MITSCVHVLPLILGISLCVSWLLTFLSFSSEFPHVPLVRVNLIPAFWISYCFWILPGPFSCVNLLDRSLVLSQLPVDFRVGIILNKYHLTIALCLYSCPKPLLQGSPAQIVTIYTCFWHDRPKLPLENNPSMETIEIKLIINWLINYYLDSDMNDMLTCWRALNNKEPRSTTSATWTWIFN